MAGEKRDLEGPATSKDLVEVTNCIGNELQRIGPYLGLSYVEIQHIEANNKKLDQQILDMLYHWRQNEQRLRKKASLSSLFKILQKVDKAVIDWVKLRKTFGLPSYIDEKPSIPAKNHSPKATSILSHLNLNDEAILRNAFRDIFPVGCFRDGRLFTLEEDHIKVLLKCVESTKDGSFGNVHFSSKPKDWAYTSLDIAFTLKEIDGKTSTTSSICNEKLASRIMHFAIVPLLAAGKDINTQIFYFLYPHFTNGDLAAAIEKNATWQKGSETPWNQMSVLRVLYQIASAINYLHTAVPGIRKAVIHNDISSKHIYLDAYWNARLTDFGFAEEINETHLSSNRVKCDYVSFGGVILELLTFQPQVLDQEAINRLIKQDPAWKDANIIGRTLSSLEKSYITLLIKDIFKSSSIKKYLTNLAEQLIGQIPNVTEGIDMHVIVKNIKIKLIGLGGSMWCNGVEQTKCQICLINQPGDCYIKHPHCDSVQICIACIRNSNINSIQCVSCGHNIEGVIGNKWAALLIAGNDPANANIANMFYDSVQKVKNMMISKCPLVMGISEKHVETVAFKEHELGDPTVAFDQAFQNLKDLKLKTLLIYYFGHYEDGNGFPLGNGYLSIMEMKKKLDELKDNRSTDTYKKVILILDCCQAPALEVPNTVIQINACQTNQNAEVIRTMQTSIFTKYFIQCLMGKSPTTPCSAALSLQQCIICRNLASEGGFITVEKILRYINEHYRSNNQGDIRPVQYARQITADDTKIAYFTDTEISYEFRHCMTGNEVMQKIMFSRLYNTTMEELFKILFEYYNNTMNLNLDTQKYFNIICITTETHQKNQLPEEIDTKDKLYGAWVGKRPLIVSLRDPKRICKGRVGLCKDTTNLKKKLANVKIQDGNLSWNICKTLQSDVCCLDISCIYESHKNLEKYSGLKIDIPNDNFYCMELVKRQESATK